MFRGLGLLVASLLAAAPLAADEPPVLEALTFEQAVARAIERNPSVGQAHQAIAAAQARLDQARSVFRPEIDGTVSTTVLDEARGFAGQITQPRRQTALGATVEYPVLAADRWALRTQAADRVGIARLSAADTRRLVAVNAAESFLGVVAARRLLEISVRNRDTARALEEYARIRLEEGQGSWVNHVRAAQELATSEGRVLSAELAVRQAQEALGVAVFAPGPVDAAGDPELQPAALPSDEAWLEERPDVRLLSAEVAAADRLVHDVWKSWLPSATLGFAPRYVTPLGAFEPASTWRAYVELDVPIYDGTLGASKRLRQADRETARLRLEGLRTQARSEMRFAREAVARHEAIVAQSRAAAEGAAEALRITEIAYRAGATTNIEVVQAQQTARNAETALAQAEDRLRQARLDLLVALGRFPG
jgi:outer membrane protein TolC